MLGLNDLIPSDISTAEIKERILKAEEIMRTMPQLELQTKHYFADGTYAREILIPAGCILTGRIHRNNDYNIVYYGEMDVMTEHGMKRVVGPCSFTGKAGVKQIGVAYSDCLWTTIHATNETDFDALEEALYLPEEGEMMFDYATGKVKHPTVESTVEGELK